MWRNFKFRKANRKWLPVVIAMFGFLPPLHAQIPLMNSGLLVPNEGQVVDDSSSIATYLHSYWVKDNLLFAVTDWGMSYVLIKGKGDSIEKYRIDVKLKYSGQNLKLSKEKSLWDYDSSAFFQYFYPHLSNGIKVFPAIQVTYPNIISGVDLIFRMDTVRKELNIDWRIKDVSRFSKLHFEIKGAYDVKEVSGNLCLYFTEEDSVCEKAPVLLKQNVDAKPISSKWLISNPKEEDTWIARIHLPKDISSQEIYIDPPLVWSTLIRGSDWDRFLSVHADSQTVWVCGATGSTTFPIQTYTGAYNDNTHNGGVDGFIGAFNKSNFSLRWMTFYGGSGDDYLYSIWSDGTAVWIGGRSASSDFPLQSAGGYFDNTLDGSSDAVLLKFDVSGARLWATYYGGSNSEVRSECDMTVVTSPQDVYFLFGTRSSTMATSGAPGSYVQATIGGGWDAYIVAFDKNTLNPVWQTYLGGSGDEGHCIKASLDSRFLWTTIRTYSSNMPTVAVSGAYNNPTYSNGGDATIYKFSHSGTMLWGTYLGTSGNDYFTGIYSDGTQIYLGGTSNNNGLSSLPWWRNSFAGLRDAIIASFDTSGAPLWGMYYGGSGEENFHVAAGSPCGALLGGHGRATTPVASDSAIIGSNTYFQSTSVSGGSWDGFLLWVASNGQVLWASFWDNGSVDVAGSAYYDGEYAYFTGFVETGNLPVVTGPPGAYLDSVRSPATDQWIAAFDFPNPLKLISVSIDTPRNCVEPYVFRVAYSGGISPNLIWSNGIDSTDSLVVYPVDTAQTISFMLIDTFCQKEVFSDTFFIPPRSAGIIDTLIDTPVCFGAPNGSISLITSPGTIVIWYPFGDTTNSIANLDSGTYTAIVIDTAFGCADTLTFRLSYLSYLSVDTSISLVQCEPLLFEYSATAVGGVGTVSFQWIDTPVIGVPLITPPDTHVLVVYDDLNCADTIIFLSPPFSPPSVEFSPSVDTIIWREEAVAVSVSGEVERISSYYWTVIGVDDPPQNLTPILAPDSTTMYIFHGISPEGCEVIDTIIIVVEYIEEVYVPDAFSPNGDGVNDVFRVRARGTMNFNMRIYNRWGIKVFETSETTGEWDGTYRGTPQDVDAYVVVIKVKFRSGKEQLIKKPILLIR
ncbi:MAG: gliding motility-associated C-terminal domain-containing protein [Chlorobi bacterium]|nr:gliding motility-associated C-terminal domain-containing protein [Chlorobiota bacterium]